MRQFKTAIKDALASKTDVRAMMRARSALQRFPVAQWVEDLETLQSTSIRIHHKYNDPSDPNFTTGLSGYARSMFSPSMLSLSIRSPSLSRQNSRDSSFDLTEPVQSSWSGPGKARSGTLTKTSPSSANSTRNSSREGSVNHGRQAPPGLTKLTLPTKKDFKKKSPRNPFLLVGEEDSDNELEMGAPDGRLRADSYCMSPISPATRSLSTGLNSPLSGNNTPRLGSRQLLGRNRQASHASLRDIAGKIQSSDELMDDYFVPPFASSQNERPGSSSGNSVLSLDSVIGDRRDFKLQAVDPFFTDSTGMYGDKFDGMLTELNGKSSEGHLCIEEFLVKSEKQWFNRFHDAKLGKSPGSPASSIFRMPWSNKSTASDLEVPSRNIAMLNINSPRQENFREFDLHEDYTAPTGLRRLMQQKLGDWPVYAFLLAFVSGKCLSEYGGNTNHNYRVKLLRQTLTR